MKKRLLSFLLVMGLLLQGCSLPGQKTEDAETQAAEENETVTEAPEATEEASEETVEKEPQAPTKEEVLAMRETVLEGMSEDEIERLTENIKIANLQLENAYLNENIFDKLSDPDSPYWQYFDQAGEIQLGWWYKGGIWPKETIMKMENITEEEFEETYTEPGMVYNRFDAENAIELLTDMQSSVQNEQLSSDLQQLIDLTQLAEDTHEVEYVNEIYQILHDMDYFLLRYGIDDVGKYTLDDSTVSKYYGVLNVYNQE